MTWLSNHPLLSAPHVQVETPYPPNVLLPGRVGKNYSNFHLGLRAKLIVLFDIGDIKVMIFGCNSIVSSCIYMGYPRFPYVGPEKHMKTAVTETQPSVSFGCHCFYVGVHFLHLLGLSSSSPYQPSPIPTHCYRDIRY